MVPKLAKSGLFTLSLLILCNARASAQSPGKFAVPDRVPNNRFFADRFVVQRPALSFNGFSCTQSDNCHHGLGVAEVLSDLLDANTDHLTVEYFSELVGWANRSITLTPAARSEIIDNSRVLQARGTLALLLIVLEGNAYSTTRLKERFIDLPMSAADATTDFFGILMQFDAYRIRKNMSDDAVKWTVPLSNLARSLDLYLAIENAIDFYASHLFADRLPSLPSCSAKASFLALISEESDRLDDLGNEPVFFGIKRDEIQPGNWPMKVHVAVAYASLGQQEETTASCVSLPAHPYLRWMERGFRSAGAPTAQNRSKHWNYQTGSGNRFFAEGPYYFHLTLSEIVPFWHAVRINDLLDFHPDFDLDDPFQSDWFIEPIGWLADTVTPAGETLPLDDGNRIFMSNASLMRWHADYGDAQTGQKYAWIADKKPGSTPHNPSLLPLHLAIPRIGFQNGMPPVPSVGTVREGEIARTSEQTVIVRRTSSDSIGLQHTHYLALNGEYGNAIVRGEGHEQPDQLQLLYYVDDTAVLLDSGYDDAEGLNNSSWNHYYDHNVLTVLRNGEIGEGGLPPPMPSLFAFRIVSEHAPAHYLAHRSYGKLDLLSGKVMLGLSDGVGDEVEPRATAEYIRHTLFVGGASRPYLIDVNRGVSTADDLQFRMSYHVGGEIVTSDPLNYSWRFNRASESELETRITAFRTDGPLTREIAIDSVMEKFRESESIARLDLRSTDFGGEFTTVAYIEANSPGELSVRPFPVPVEGTSGDRRWAAFVQTLPSGAVDLFITAFGIERGVSGRISARITLHSQMIEFDLKPDADFGFVRLRPSIDGSWLVDPDYVFNLSLDLTHVGVQTIEAPGQPQGLLIHPNPVRDLAEIDYVVRIPGHVRLSVFDVQGREIEVLVDAPHSSGSYVRRWSTNQLANGAYFLQLTSGDKSQTQSFIVQQ